MKHLILSLALLALSIPAFAQTPPSETFNVVTANELILLGGVNHAAGNYLTTFDSNNDLSYTLFAPTPGPQGPPGVAGPQGAQGIQGVPGKPAPTPKAVLETVTTATPVPAFPSRYCQSFIVQDALYPYQNTPIWNIYTGDPGDTFGDIRVTVSAIDTLTICVRNMTTTEQALNNITFLVKFY